MLFGSNVTYAVLHVNICLSDVELHAKIKPKLVDFFSRSLNHTRVGCLEPIYRDFEILQICKLCALCVIVNVYGYESCSRVLAM